jgi:hypothetical protein
MLKAKKVIFLLLQNQSPIAIDLGGTSLCLNQGGEILRISTPCYTASARIGTPNRNHCQEQ